MSRFRLLLGYGFVFAVLIFISSTRQVKAGCSGNLSCGVLQTKCTCNLGGGACIGGGSPCGPGGNGTCGCVDECISVDLKSCTRYLNAGSCTGHPKCSICDAFDGCGWSNPPPGPTPPPGGGGGGCSSDYCAGPAQCASQGGTSGNAGPRPSGGSCTGGNRMCCISGGGGGGGGGDPCPGDTCAGSCCNYNCGHSCIVSADCRNAATGQVFYCQPSAGGGLGTCVNPICPNNTIPGSICGCSGGIACGAPCAGGCSAGSVCRYTQAPGGGCFGGSTICIGNSSGINTYNPDYVTPKCTAGDTGNSYLLRVSTGQSTGFTQAQYDSTCKQNVWWQVKGGDVITNGSLQSTVVPGSKFILDGQGGYPGNVVLGGSMNLTNANISSKGWNGNTSYTGKTYDSVYFNGIVPGNVTFNNLGGTATQADFSAGLAVDGYYWYKAPGNLTINGDVLITGNRKVILFVNGNLTINGKINIQTKGQGFFMTIVSGNINVAGTVTAAAGLPALEGIYECDGIFDTGVSNSNLYVRGTVAAWGGVGLKRDLLGANLTNPAETFEFAPDITMLYPRDLVQDKLGWKEVVP